MSDDNSFSVVDVGKLAKPADTLVKKISDAVGGYFRPYQIKRVAQAEAEAAIIRAEGEIQVTDIQRRAMHRFMDEEAKRQQNIEEITDKALPLLEDKSTPEKVDDDWITNFFDKCRIVSNEEMQGLWSKILAGEANAPGSFSKRTVNFLSDLDKKDAELFTELCGFGWIISRFTPLVFDVQDAIYKDKGITFNSLSHLDSLGLIHFENLSGFLRKGFSDPFKVAYCGKTLDLTFRSVTDPELPIGVVLLTSIGEELATVVNAFGVSGFFDYTKEKWKRFILSDSPQTTPPQSSSEPSQ